MPSIKSLFGTNLHPDLVKLQCEHGSKTSYTDAQLILNKLSSVKRTVNNPMSIRQVKEGLTKETSITALCDGAENCWNVVDSLIARCKNIESILDWFHIAKKFQNTRMGEKYNLSLAKAKWSLWHGDLETTLAKLLALKNKVRNKNKRDKLTALHQYLDNNR